MIHLPTSTAFKDNRRPAFNLQVKGYAHRPRL